MNNVLFFGLLFLIMFICYRLGMIRGKKLAEYSRLMVIYELWTKGYILGYIDTVKGLMIYRIKDLYDGSSKSDEKKENS